MDSQWTTTRLPPDFHQTSTRLPANSKQVSIWRAHLDSFLEANFESPFKELLWELIVFYGETRLPTGTNKLLLGSQQTQPVCNLVTLFGELFWRHHLMNSQQTPSGFPADSQRTQSELKVDSQRTPSRLPADSFGDLTWRAHLESSFLTSPKKRTKK